MKSDKIVRCTATEWTWVPTPTTGIYAVEFADAERKLRGKQIGEAAKNWHAELRVMGDVAIVVELDGLHFVPHNNATWKTKVQLTDASTVKDEAEFMLTSEGR